jgi:hypothetical protein
VSDERFDLYMTRGAALRLAAAGAAGLALGARSARAALWRDFERDYGRHLL